MGHSRDILTRSCLSRSCLSRENFSRSCSSPRLLSRSRSHGTQKAPGQNFRVLLKSDSGTDRDSCPKMSGFVTLRDFSSGTVPQIFVPIPTSLWLWVPVPIMGIRGLGPGSQHCPGTTAHPCLRDFLHISTEIYIFYEDFYVFCFSQFP